MDKVPSLPPGVVGAPKGEVLFSVGALDWSPVPPRQVPRLPYVSIKWWGDPGPGVTISASRGESISFPVCCSPRHLVRYLRDMSTLNLTLVEFTSNESLGTIAVDVRYLDANSAIRGSFPVISLTGQHLASLDLDIQIVYHSTGSTLSSFEAAEHQAVLGLPLAVSAGSKHHDGAAAQEHTAQLTQVLPNLAGPAQLLAGTSTWLPAMAGPSHLTTWQVDTTAGLTVHDNAPRSEAEGRLDWETSLEQLDLFEVLHNRLSRNVDAFYAVFRIWEGSGPQRSIHSLLTLLRKHRVLQYTMTKNQSVYLELVMDPAEDLTLDLDNILQAIRHAQEAGLRVRTAQLDPIIPQLQPLFRYLEQRNLDLRALFRDAEPAGLGRAAAGQEMKKVRGVIGIKQLVSWMRSALPGDLTSTEMIRYMTILITHVGTSPLGSVTYQDLQVVGQLVMDHSKATGRILEPAQKPIMRTDVQPQGGAIDRQHALMRLKNRSNRPVRRTGNVPPSADADDHHLLPAPAPDTSSYGPQVAVNSDVQGRGTLDQGRQRLPHTAGLLLPESQFQDLPVNNLLAIQQAAAQRSTGLTLKERVPVRVPVAGGTGAGNAAVQPASRTHHALPWHPTSPTAHAATQLSSSPSPDSPTSKHPAHAHRQAGPGQDAADDADVEAFMKQASELQRELARRVDKARSAQSSPARGARVPGSRLTAESLAMLSSAPPEVLLDLLHASPHDSTHSRDRHRPRWGGDSAGVHSHSSSPHSYHTRMRHATGSGFQSPAGHTSRSESPFDHGKYRGVRRFGAGAEQMGESDTDEEGAATFAEQQLLQQLFYNSVDPAGVAHVTRVVSPSGVHPSQQPDNVAPGDTDDPRKRLKPLETGADGSPVQSDQPGSAAESPTARHGDLGVHVHIKAVALGLMPRQSLQAYIHSGDMQLVLKVRSTCGTAHHVAVLPPGLLVDATALETAENSHPGLELFLPAVPPEDPLTSPPTRVFLEVWQLPGRCASPDMSSTPASSPRFLGYLGHEPASPGPANTAALEAALSNVQGAHLVGVAEMTLDVADSRVVQGDSAVPHTAMVQGQFPFMDLLGSETPLGHVKAVAQLVGGWGPLLRHTWRVTLCGAAGLPDADGMAAAGLPTPEARYAKYLYPGEPSALVTEEVPPSESPIFAATALHSVVLPAYSPPTMTVLLGGPVTDPATQQQQQPHLLVFELWDKWTSGPDTCVGIATLPLRDLLSLTPGDTTSLTLPLTLHPGACEVVAMAPKRHDTLPSPSQSPFNDQSMPDDNALRTQQACLEIRIQSECAVVGHCTAEPLPASHSPGPTSQPSSPPPSNSPPPPGKRPTDKPNAGQDAHPPSPTAVINAHVVPPTAPVQARISVDVVAACGLQSAVQEASAWLGGGSAVLGKAMQLGPHPYVTLNLFPADARLTKRIPTLRTPFQAQSFCPRYDWHQELDLTLDTAALSGLLTQQMCVEVWHHPSRSLAALLAQQQADARGSRPAGRADAPTAGQDVLLGSGTCALDKLLLRPNGVQGWIVIRSARGTAVGAVQLALRITHLDGSPLDTCLAALPPLEVPRGLGALLPAELPKPAVELEVFQGQWARCTVYVEHANLMPHPTTSSAAAVRQAASRNHVYYVTYTLPGSDVEVNSVAKAAAPDKHPPAPPGPSFSKGLAPGPPPTTHIPLQHVAVHWVRADARVAGALARSPMQLRLWRALERASTAPSASSPVKPTGPSNSPWVSNQCLGFVDIDLSQLVVRPAGSKQLPARWASGTFNLVDPSATCYTPAHVRVKFLLELSPPSNPPTTAVLAAGSWQPGDEYAAAVATQQPSQDDVTQQDQGGVQGDASAEQQSNSDTYAYSPGAASPTSSPAAVSPRLADQPPADDPRLPPGVQGSSVQGTPSRQQPSLGGGIDMFSISKASPMVQVGPGQVIATHPVLGMSQISTVQQSSPSNTVATGGAGQELAVPDSTDQQAVATLSRGSSDAADRLREQLQELEVLSLQWGRRLRQQELQEQFLAGLLQHGTGGGGQQAQGTSALLPRPINAPSSSDQLNTVDQLVEATIGRQVAAVAPPAQQHPQLLLPPAAINVSTAGRSQQQAQSPSAGPRITATVPIGSMHVPSGLQSVQGASDTAAGSSTWHTQGLPSATAVAQQVVGGGVDAASHDDDTRVPQEEVQNRTGVWVSTVGTGNRPGLQQQQLPGTLAALETCSDDGGDLVFGGYSASEADTDELMAGITVSYDVHDGPGAGRGGGAGGVGSGAGISSPPFDFESVSPPKQEDWMFAFARPEARSQPLRSLAVQHPGMSHIHDVNPSQPPPTAPAPAASYPAHPAMQAAASQNQQAAPPAGTAAGPSPSGRQWSAAAAGAAGPAGGSLQARLDSLLSGFQAHVSGMVSGNLSSARHRAGGGGSDDEDGSLPVSRTTLHVSDQDAPPRVMFANALPPVQPDFELKYMDGVP